MQDWQQRVVDEKAALDIKINALSKYISTLGNWDPSSNYDHELFNEQFYCMREYSEILNQRILKF